MTLKPEIIIVSKCCHTIFNLVPGSGNTVKPVCVNCGNFCDTESHNINSQHDIEGFINKQNKGVEL